MTVDPVLVVYGHDVVATITPDTNMSVDSIESGAETYVNNPNFGKAIIEDVENIIRPLGFFRNKAKSIVSCSKQLIENFDGVVPNDVDKLH